MRGHFSSAKKLYKLVEEHEEIRESPENKDSHMMLVGWNLEKQMVARLIRLVSVWELHNYLMEQCQWSKDENGKPIISDTFLRTFLKSRMPHVKKASLRNKEMCGCSQCMTMKLLHNALMRHRFSTLIRLDKEVEEMNAAIGVLCDSTRRKKNLLDKVNRIMVIKKEFQKHVYIDRLVRELRGEHALDQIMCPQTFVNDGYYRKLPCCTRNCPNCPMYVSHDLEMSNNVEINFQTYVKHRKCSLHGDVLGHVCGDCEGLEEGEKVGKISEKPVLANVKRKASVFMKNYYLPTLEKHAYHYSHVIWLSNKKCVTDWQDLLHKISNLNRHFITTLHDYAEKWKLEFNEEVQHEHFGNSSVVSIEGYLVQQFNHLLYNGVEKETVNMQLVDEEGDEAKDWLVNEFHSFLLDNKNQNAATTHKHMNLLLETMFSDGILKPHLGYMLDRTDGCQDQYRKTQVLNLLSYLAFKFRIVVDRSIKAPGHGKDMCDGLNAVDKHYIQNLLLSPNKDTEITNDKKLTANRIISNKAGETMSVSIANKCVTVL